MNLLIQEAMMIPAPNKIARLTLLSLALGALAMPQVALAATSKPAKTAPRAATAKKKPASKTAQAPRTAVNNSAAVFYRNAFAAVEAGKTDLVQTLATRGPDPILNKVLRGYAMTLPGNDYTFDELSGFIEKNPDWPKLKGIQMIVEQKMPATMSAAEIALWYTNHAPITLVGFYRYIDALNQTGRENEALKAVRERWIGGTFGQDDQTAFFARFRSWLTNNDMWARTDRLLWDNEATQARRMAPYLTATDQNVLEARLALYGDDSRASSWLERIPRDAQNDPGLLYQRLRYYVKNNRDDEANDLLLNAPAELGKPGSWWNQRNIMVRRAIDAQNFSLAYRLAANHGQTEPKPLVQAEFLSGWLALRFLNNATVAVQHFKNLYNAASTPISRARGAYWMGRCYEVLGNKLEAEQAYQDAAIFNTSYYGQLASTRIYGTPVQIAKFDPPLPDSVRKSFFARDNIRAIKRLMDINQKERAKTFFMAAADYATKRADFILLTEVAGQVRRPDLGILAVKEATQKNMLIQNGGFPLVNVAIPSPPEQAFTLSLIRQESMFNPDATSSVGARGLMQLMPRTAKEVSHKIGLPYSEARLEDPEYNIQLGTAFVAKQLDRFDGSYVLALAGYNAGPSRARDWVEKYGDPRSANIDTIDWIEAIPIPETRNYVQRILENIQVYRAKLAGGHAPLRILEDLKR